jgi:hypothetical protein
MTQNKKPHDRATSIICNKCRKPGHIYKQCLLVLQSFNKPNKILSVSSNNENNKEAYNLTNKNIPDLDSSKKDIVEVIFCRSIKGIVAKTMEKILVGKERHKVKLVRKNNLQGSSCRWTIKAEKRDTS